MTLDELERAFVNADKAGDTEAARQLSMVITEARKNPSNQIPGAVINVWKPKEATLGEKSVGALETGATVLTGATAGTVGMLAGAATDIVDGVISGRFARNPNFGKRAIDFASAVTYQPRTEQGQENVEEIGQALQGIPAIVPVIGPIGAVGRSIKTGTQMATTAARAAAPMVAPAMAQAMQAVKAAPVVQKVMQRPARPGQVVQPTAPTAQVVQQAVSQVEPPPVKAPEAAPTPSDYKQIADLTKKATSWMPGSATAEAKLADLAQVDLGAMEAAKRLGIDVPLDVFSDNPQMRELAGLARSQVGSEASASWVNTVRGYVEKADNLMQELDAQFIEGRPSVDIVSTKVLSNLKTTREGLENQAKQMYGKINEAVPQALAAKMPKTTSLLDELTTNLGEQGLNAQERKLIAMSSNPATTYGALMREKDLIGQALDGQKSPWSGTQEASLKRLYGALAEDQLETVGAYGGDAMRKELRAANLLTAQRKALEKRIVNAFGREADGSAANLMKAAIKSASTGDANSFIRLMKAVPKDLKRETISTALAYVTANRSPGSDNNFGFTQFANIYKGLRSTPQVYSVIEKELGPQASARLRDLYALSNKMAKAQSQVLNTGKANQGLSEALAAEGLINKITETAAGAAAYGATAKIAGPVTAFGVSNAIKALIKPNNAKRLDTVSKLFTDKDFQALAVEAAMKAEPTSQAIRRAAVSRAFTDFAEANELPKELNARIQWIEEALKEGRKI